MRRTIRTGDEVHVEGVVAPLPGLPDLHFLVTRVSLPSDDIRGKSLQRTNANLLLAVIYVFREAAAADEEGLPSGVCVC